MNRRQFVKSAAVFGAGLMLPSNLVSAVAIPDLAVAYGKDPGAIVRAAVKALGGMGRFVSKGDIVVVKPNIGWDRAPEYAANTNPHVVAETVRMCLEAGARKVKVFDNTCDNARRCYESSMIEASAKRAGADVFICNERRFKEVDTGGKTLKKWPIYTDAIEADKIINIPIAKHHGLSGLTLGMKNMMGVMGGRRGMLHFRLDKNLVDMAGFMKPSLTILDAYRVLTTKGPQGGDLKYVKQLDTVVAGVDFVAVDSYGASLFGLSPGDISHVKLAAEKGLGNMDLGKLNIARVKV